MKFNADITDCSSVIKAIMAYEKKTLVEVARTLNVTQQNVSKKFYRADLRESDIKELADVLGYDVEVTFIKREK